MARSKKADKGILKSPFTYFGGKSKVANVVWYAFGNIKNYVEPFAGSLAVLLHEPHNSKRTETVNDLDCFIANFWRALKEDPEKVAFYSDNPVNEADYHARHVWLVNKKKDFAERVMGDHEFFDSKVAGFWVWGNNIAIGIGNTWGIGNSAWNLDKEKRLVKVKKNGIGISKQRPICSNIKKNKQTLEERIEYLLLLRDRIRTVNVCCGDWERVCSPAIVQQEDSSGVFLDPPYLDDLGNHCYNESDNVVAKDVFDWSIENGNKNGVKVAYCGYEGQFNFPKNWECFKWISGGGYELAADEKDRTGNRYRERIWFSPNCNSVR